MVGRSREGHEEMRGEDMEHRIEEKVWEEERRKRI